LYHAGVYIHVIPAKVQGIAALVTALDICGRITKEELEKEFPVPSAI